MAPSEYAVHRVRIANMKKKAAPGDSPGRGSAFLSSGKAIFASAEERHIAHALDEGLAHVEAGLLQQLQYADDLAGSVARYLFDAGGKRVRPLLTLLASQWGKGVTDQVVIAAQVIELTHLATLYHDDVMDEAVKRRGVPAAQKVWDNSVAILAGDLLFARAGALGVELGQDSMRRQAQTFERLVVGQLRETVGPGTNEDPVAHYLGVLADKTGSLIALAGEFGITLSGGPKEYVPAIQAFGEQIGVAFQLMDDVIDLSPDESVTGKKAGTDIRRGVATLPLLLLRESAAENLGDEDLLRILDRAAVGDLHEEEFSDAIERLKNHPVTSTTVSEAERVAREAVSHLEAIPKGTVTAALERFASQVVNRDG